MAWPLKTFLFCMSLETGGVIISWLHLILDLLLLLFTVAFLTIYDCEDFEKLINCSPNAICLFNRGKYFFAMSLITAMIIICLAALPYLCIRGIQNRNFTRVKPFMWYLPFVAVFSMYEILFLTRKGIIIGSIMGVINGYFSVVIYSLYVMLRDEPKRGLTP